MFVDTHCHLNHEDFAVDQAAVRARAHAAGVTRLLCIGYDEASSQRAVQFAQAGHGLFAAIGLHPDAGAEWNSETEARLRALYHNNQAQVAAYGEIGLDYHWETLPRARQQDVFAAQIAFAAALSPTLPLVIHCREAQSDTRRTAQADVLSLLRESGTLAPIVMHCFTGDWESARACLDAGCFLGIGGVVTFKKSELLREAVARAPLNRLLLETDCPYLAPQGWRGKRNEPSHLPAIAQAVADAKELPLPTVADTTTANSLALFGLGVEVSTKL